MSSAGDKTCSRCGYTGPLESFAKDKRSDDGRGSWCRECQRLVNRHYMRRAYERDREKWRRRGKTRPRKKPRAAHKNRAGHALRHQVRIGAIERPTTCEECGAADVPIHAHHDDYSKPFDVAWLCPPCHGLRHRIPDHYCALEGE